MRQCTKNVTIIMISSIFYDDQAGVGSQYSIADIHENFEHSRDLSMHCIHLNWAYQNLIARLD